MMTPEHRSTSHFSPGTIWEKLYLSWILICFFMVWVGTWAVNQPVAVFGFPLVYAWCTLWGLAWLVGCLLLGLKIERDDEQARRG